MNNREKRINFVNKFNNEAKEYLINNNILSVDLEFNIAEEVFILQCVENQYAMNFINGKIKDKGGFVASDFIEKYNYNYLILNGYHKINEISNVLLFMQQAEYDLELLKSLCNKMNKFIYKDIVNGKINTDNPTETDCCVSLFMISLMNNNFVRNCDMELIYDSQVILSACISSKSLHKDTSNELRNEYKECLENLKISKGITLDEIVNKTNDYYIQHLNTYGVIKSYEDLMKLRDKESRRRLSLIEQDKHISKSEQLSTISRHLVHFGENSFRCYSRMKKYIISDNDIDYSLWVLDLLLKRGAVVTSKEVEFINILVARILDYMMVDIIGIATEKSLALNNSYIDFHKELSLKDEINLKLTDENNDLKVKTLSLEDDNSRLKRELEKAKAEISRMKNKKNKEFNDKKELESLRELFFNMERDELSLDDLNNIDLSYDKDKKIVFVGSNSNLHNKLEPIFERCKYIEADSVTRDLSFLKGMDIVFLHTHISHSMYYKVLETIKSSNTRLIFLNSTNVDILAKEMINFINK